MSSRFEERRKEFDRDFKRMRVFGLIGAVVMGLFNIGLILFGAWVVIMVMRYFGVI